jgi:hypothetical protein
MTGIAGSPVYLLPVARGPKRKNDRLGNEYARVNPVGIFAIEILASDAG